MNHMDADLDNPDWRDNSPAGELLKEKSLLKNNIQYKVKSLIDAAIDNEVEAIAHQCNCFNTMRSGIAPQIAKTFPKAHQVDQKTIKGNINKLGCFTYAYDRGIHVYNLYGQHGYSRVGQDTDYEELNSALKQMSEHCIVKNIGLPKLGCGLGGGDWSIVEKIIKEQLTNKGFNVTIYVLKEEEILRG